MASETTIRIRLILNAEAQNDFHPGHPLTMRGILYTIAAIQNRMETLGLSPEQAMNALKVPEAERPKYTSLLGP